MLNAVIIMIFLLIGVGIGVAAMALVRINYGGDGNEARAARASFQEKLATARDSAARLDKTINDYMEYQSLRADVAKLAGQGYTPTSAPVQQESVRDWIAAQPSFARAACEYVMKNGTPEEVSELIDRFNADTGQTAAKSDQPDRAEVPTADATTRHQLILAAFDLALAAKQVITDCFAPLPVDMTAGEKKAVFALDRANMAFEIARKNYEGMCPVIHVKLEPFNPIAEDLVLGKGEWEKILKKLNSKKGGV